MNILTTVLAFLLALGPLIIFHELGHYSIARLCGVKVLRFSVGMGKIVWSRRFGPDQTEWAISALPLGGYVKMLDARDPDAPPMSEADKAREFTRQNVWKRIAIVAAGPISNFLLAIALFAGLYMNGIEEPTTKMRPMAEATPAYQAGLRGGETVTAVNGVAINAWSELRWEILQAVVDKHEARLEVRQPDGGRFAVLLPAQTLSRLDVDSDVLGALGMGLWRPAPVIEEVVPGGAGARAGMKVGDLLTTVDGKPVRDGMDLIEIVRASAGKVLTIGLQRGSEAFTLKVTPERDAASRNGVIRVRTAMTPQLAVVRDDPLRAVEKGVRRTWDTSVMSIKMIGKMITGEVSWKNVTGPITIADYAGQSARMGPSVFLAFIAFISISLGVMNLLPIPVLDGGLLLYYSLEVLTGRPLPERIGEFLQRAGVGLLVMLMALAVFNDVARLL